MLQDNLGNLVEIHTALFKSKHGIYSQFEEDFISDNIEMSKGFLTMKAPSVENYILHIIYNYTKHSLFCSGFKYLLDISFLHKKYSVNWNNIILKAKNINIEKETTLTVLALEKLKLINNISTKYKFNFLIESQEKLKDMLDLVFLNRSSENYLFLADSFFYKLTVLTKQIFFQQNQRFLMSSILIIILSKYSLHTHYT